MVTPITRHSAPRGRDKCEISIKTLLINCQHNLKSNELLSRPLTRANVYVTMTVCVCVCVSVIEFKDLKTVASDKTHNLVLLTEWFQRQTVFDRVQPALIHFMLYLSVNSTKCKQSV